MVDQKHREARLRELLNLFGEALGGGHGWKTKAARLLGFSQTQFSRMLLTERALSNETLNRVARDLGVKPAFYEASPQEAVGPFFAGHPTEAAKLFWAHDNRDPETAYVHPREIGPKHRDLAARILEAAVNKEPVEKIAKLGGELAAMIIFDFDD